MERWRVGRCRRFLPREQRRGVGDAGPHAFEQVVASGIISAIEGVPERHLICRAVALEDESTKTQQRGAVVTAVIQPAWRPMTSSTNTLVEVFAIDATS